jgi:hypothetical protein
MNASKRPNTTFIKAVLWGAIFFSVLALIYHIRWFVPFLENNSHGVVPEHQMPVVWFVVQICNNIIFLFVSFLLYRLFGKFQQTGYFDTNSLKAFDGVILSCIVLAFLGLVQVISNNIYELHFNQWTSLFAISNLLFRSFTRLLIFQDPQTMYFLLAIVLWSVRQFVTKALMVKKENEAFV